jgi:hypothetical protein
MLDVFVLLIASFKSSQKAFKKILVLISVSPIFPIPSPKVVKLQNKDMSYH